MRQQTSQSTVLMNQPRTILACIFLAIVTVVVFSPVRRAEFVNYDDENYVTQNVHVQAGLTWNTFTWAWRSTEWDNWHPLTWLSHALDCQLYGLNPVGHHVTNVLLHTLNVLLLFLLLTRERLRRDAACSSPQYSRCILLTWNPWLGWPSARTF